jgi:flagellar biosynthetic protein FlhB
MAGDKTEKATPKRRKEARKEGQVGRSQDLGGAVVLITGILMLGVTGPSIAQRLAGAVSDSLQAGAAHDVTASTVGNLFMNTGRTAAMCLWPVVAACALMGVLVSGAQTGFRVTPKAAKPKLTKVNPLKGAKRIFGKDAIFETGKNIAKVAVVAGIAMWSLVPHIGDTAAMVGASPYEFGGALAGKVKGIALHAAFGYLLIGVIDYVYQRWRTEKSLRMDKQEIKDEGKGQDLPAEVKGAIRRRQIQAARARMMDAIPTADVVVTNPTHFAVALKYDGQKAAPEVVAKGQDLVALRIRELAAEHDVPIVPDPPLARSLHATVDVGQAIPEELFQAVAQILAYVYRVAGRRRLSAA